MCAWRQARVFLSQSRAAVERIGGRFEGMLHAHRLASDVTPRDSSRYAIIAAEWPEGKARLTQRLARECRTGLSRVFGWLQFAEAVAHATLGEDIDRFGGVALQLLAQIGDVEPQIVPLVAVFRPPDL